MLAFSSLLCLGRRTVTGMLATSGFQFMDWSTHYRLFERTRLDPRVFFDTTLHAAGPYLAPHAPLVALLDDTILRKRGRCVSGAAWRRDPLGPHFQTNLVWGQRFVQCSLALPANQTLSTGSARAIPITFRHAPSAKKPGKKAPPEEWTAYRNASKALCLSHQGTEEIQNLRARMDADPSHAHRRLIMCTDNSYTNKTVLRNLPERTTLIGRIRKDTRLNMLPEDASTGRGRTRCYGAKLPTPEEIRLDPSIPWKTVRVHAAGKDYDFQIKSIGPIRWRVAGGKRTLRLIVIRPLGYRLRNGGRVLYREPAYLICTDPDLPEDELLQAYVWRWDIEVNFRDEKTLLGVGQAQVRTPRAVCTVPQFQVAAYSFLLMAEHQLRASIERIPRPSWQSTSENADARIPTTELLRLLRKEVWGETMGVENFSDFVTRREQRAKPHKFENGLANAVMYAS